MIYFQVHTVLCWFPLGQYFFTSFSNSCFVKNHQMTCVCLTDGFTRPGSSSTITPGLYCSLICSLSFSSLHRVVHLLLIHSAPYLVARLSRSLYPAFPPGFFLLIKCTSVLLLSILTACRISMFVCWCLLYCFDSLSCKM